MAKNEPNKYRTPQALAAAARKAAIKFNTQLKQSPLYNTVQQAAPNQEGNSQRVPLVITQPAFGVDGSPLKNQSKDVPRFYDPQTGKALDPDNLPKEFLEPVVGLYGSYASGGGLNRPGTGSTMVDQGLSNLTELGNKYADNEMIGGLVTGTFADIARTQANTGLAVMYQDAMLESMGRYQGNLENLRVGNTSKLMAQEAALTGGLMGKQGEIQTQGLRVAGDQQRQGIRVTGDEQRQGIRVTGDENRQGIRVSGEENRKGIRVTGEENLRSIRGTGVEQRKGIRVSGEENRKGIRVTGEEQRKGIRVTGEENRKGIRVSGEEDRKGIRVTGEEQRKGIQETGVQERLNIDRRGFQNRLTLGEQGTQERMNIDRRGVQNRLTLGEQGSQERMNIRERTQAQKNLRADARGAIRRSGARFFG